MERKPTSLAEQARTYCKAAGIRAHVLGTAMVGERVTT